MDWTSAEMSMIYFPEAFRIVVAALDEPSGVLLSLVPIPALNRLRRNSHTIAISANVSTLFL